MIALTQRPVLDLDGNIILEDDDRLYWPIRRVNPPRGRRLLIAPAVLVGLAAALVLHQPSDQASAYNVGGDSVYAAEVVTPADLTPSAVTVVGGSRQSALIVKSAGAPSAVGSAGHLPAPATGTTLAGGPTISPAQINAVLARYGSPMAGDGQALYDMGVKYGIDPAYCLAFFVHESGAGTQGEAVLTHNLGNIRAIAGYPSMGGYRYFDTWLEGADAWYQLIGGLYIKQWKLATVDTIIPVYAPSADSNDPTAYIDDVNQMVAGWRGR
jgi:Mannosyl-glycoprotein endo-beta-N-acetylglucosaminidase